MRYFIISLIFLSAMSSFSLWGAEKGGSFEGALTVTETRGGVSTQTIYTRKGDELRIENPDKTKPEPINIVDLAAQKLTIVYPHNSSFVVVDLNKAPAQPGTPNLPPGFPAPPNMNQLQVGAPANPSLSPPPRPGPAISPPPGFPTPPPMPSIPPMPNNPMASGPANMPQMPGNPMASSMPMMPPMPAMGGFGGAPELKKTDKTRKIQGFECTCYTVSDRMEIFEIWAMPDSALFPFRLLERNYHTRHFGPVMMEEQWVELLQKKSLFPLEATLRMANGGPRPEGLAPSGGKGNTPGGDEHGQERLSFKVDKVEQKKIDNDALFKAPENYYEIQPPPF